MNDCTNQKFWFRIRATDEFHPLTALKGKYCVIHSPVGYEYGAAVGSLAAERGPAVIMMVHLGFA